MVDGLLNPVGLPINPSKTIRDLENKVGGGGEVGVKRPTPTTPFNVKNNQDLTIKQQKPSPIDLLASHANRTQHLPTLPSAQTISIRLSEIQEKLSPLQADLKQYAKLDHFSMTPYKRIRSQGSLDNFNENVKVITKELGVKYTPPTTSSLTPEERYKNPLKDFLSYITSGQNNLEKAQSILSDAKNLDTSTALKIQLKIQSATQQIELFSSMIGKAVESMKTLASIQV